MMCTEGWFTRRAACNVTHGVLLHPASHQERLSVSSSSVVRWPQEASAPLAARHSHGRLTAGWVVSALTVGALRHGSLESIRMQMCGMSTAHSEA